MKITAEPRSDQWNADDFIGGPKTFTIAGATEGKAEQKYDIHLVGEKRVWRPPPTVRRIIMAAWGTESDDWIGKRVTLILDPDVPFGPQKVGGVRISHLSHIDGELRLASTKKRGKREPVVIQPLVTTVDPVQVQKAVAAIRNAATIPELDKIGAHAERVGISGEVRDAIDTRRAELEAQDQSGGES